MLTESLPSEYIFTGNPFFLREDDEAEGFGTIRVYLGTGRRLKAIMSGNFTSPLNINLSDIVDGLAPETLAGSNYFDYRKVSWVIEKNDGSNYSGYRYIFDGAISKQLFRQYLREGTDIFNARLLSEVRNFFWVPLQPGSLIEIKETELEPLTFIADGWSEIIVTSPGIETEYVLPIPIRGIYELDLAEIRNFMLTNGNALASVFNIHREGMKSCSIVITPAQPCPNRYLLRYRNSFGVFERLELTGKMSLKPDEFEPTEYKRYDRDVDDFITNRTREKHGVVLDANTGLKSNTELLRLMEAIMSPEVYLLGVIDEPLRVLPSAESLELALIPNGKQNVALKLTLAEDDVVFMPQLIKSIRGGRVFKEQFTEQFI